MATEYVGYELIGSDILSGLFQAWIGIAFLIGQLEQHRDGISGKALKALKTLEA